MASAWVTYDGTGCPVNANVMVDVRLIDGATLHNVRAGNLAWPNVDAWRPHMAGPAPAPTTALQHEDQFRRAISLLRGVVSSATASEVIGHDLVASYVIAMAREFLKEIKP